MNNLISRRNFLKIAGAGAGIAAAAGLAGCGAASSASTAASTASSAAASSAASAASETVKTGGTIVIGTANTPTVLGWTPSIASNANIAYQRLVFETLLNYTVDGELCGELATDWKTEPDANKITFTLLSGVKFSDGSDFNASVAKWNIEQYMAASRTEVNSVDTVEAPDDTTLVINLKSWNSSALMTLGIYIYMMSKNEFDTQGQDYMSANPVGTGPFTLDTYTDASEYNYVKNTNFHIEGKPYLDGVKMQCMSDSTTMENALLAGDIDIMVSTAAQVVLDLKDNPDYTLQLNTNGVGKEMTGILPASQPDGTPFGEAAIRQAFCYAIDTDQLNTTLGYGLYEMTNQWAAKGASTYNEDVVGYPVSVEKGIAKMEEGGYKDGFDTTFYTLPQMNDYTVAISDMLSKVGIKCTIETIDLTRHSTMATDGWGEGIYYHWATISPDLGLYMGRHLDPNGAYYKKTILHPDDAVALLNEVRAAKTDDDKQKLSWQLQSLIYDTYALFGKPMYVTMIGVFKANYVKDDGYMVNYGSSWKPADCWLNK